MGGITIEIEKICSNCRYWDWYYNDQNVEDECGKIIAEFGNCTMNHGYERVTGKNTPACEDFETMLCTICGARLMLCRSGFRCCRSNSFPLFAFDIVGNWNDIKVNRMRDVLREKFRQHQDLREKLIATRDATLIEESKSDAFWGIGKKGNGQNMLGKLLEEIREELRPKDLIDYVLEEMFAEKEIA